MTGFTAPCCTRVHSVRNENRLPKGPGARQGDHSPVLLAMALLSPVSQPSSGAFSGLLALPLARSLTGQWRPGAPPGSRVALLPHDRLAYAHPAYPASGPHLRLPGASMLLLEPPPRT